jgi:hypothetical protein
MPDDITMHVFGDSHFLLYAALPRVVPHYLVGYTMHRVGRDGISSLNIENVDSSPNTVLAFVFGEIDVRVHVARQVEHSGRTSHQIIDDLITRYMSTICSVRAAYPDNPIILISVVPPAGMDYPSFDYTLPRGGTDEDRASWTQELNSRLHQYAVEYGFGYLDQYSPFANETGLFDLEYSDDGVHIRPGLLHYIDLRSALNMALASRPGVRHLAATPDPTVPRAPA